MVQAGELAALLRVSGEGQTGAGKRDAALPVVVFGYGLRRAEIAGRDLADYEPGTGKVLVRGKGSKRRVVFATGSAGGALSDWIAVRGSEEGLLSFTVTHGGRFSPGGFRNRKGSTDMSFRIFIHRAEEAAVSSRTSPDARRTFLSSVLEPVMNYGRIAPFEAKAPRSTEVACGTARLEIEGS